MTLFSQRSKHIRIHKPAQLLVEGKDARHFFEALARHLALPGIQTHDYGGVDQLRPSLRVLASGPGFRYVASLGIVRDAEESHDGALASVRGAIRNAGLPEPGEPGRPTVNAMILPGGGRPGMLESLLGDSLRGTDEEACVAEFLKCVQDQAGVHLRRPEKALVHAYLATRPDPHVSAGVAAQKGYWDFSHDAFQQVREFLTIIHKAGTS